MDGNTIIRYKNDTRDWIFRDNDLCISKEPSKTIKDTNQSDYESNVELFGEITIQFNNEVHLLYDGPMQIKSPSIDQHRDVNYSKSNVLVKNDLRRPNIHQISTSIGSKDLKAEKQVVKQICSISPVKNSLSSVANNKTIRPSNFSSNSSNNNSSYINSKCKQIVLSQGSCSRTSYLCLPRRKIVSESTQEINVPLAKTSDTIDLTIPVKTITNKTNSQDTKNRVPHNSEIKSVEDQSVINLDNKHDKILSKSGVTILKENNDLQHNTKFIRTSDIKKSSHADNNKNIKILSVSKPESLFKDQIIYSTHLLSSEVSITAQNKISKNEQPHKVQDKIYDKTSNTNKIQISSSVEVIVLNKNRNSNNNKSLLTFQQNNSKKLENSHNVISVNNKKDSKSVDINNECLNDKSDLNNRINALNVVCDKILIFNNKNASIDVPIVKANDTKQNSIQSTKINLKEKKKILEEQSVNELKLTDNLQPFIKNETNSNKNAKSITVYDFVSLEIKDKPTEGISQKSEGEEHIHSILHSQKKILRSGKFVVSSKFKRQRRTVKANDLRTKIAKLKKLNEEKRKAELNIVQNNEIEQVSKVSEVVNVSEIFKDNLNSSEKFDEENVSSETTIIPETSSETTIIPETSSDSGTSLIPESSNDPAIIILPETSSGSETFINPETSNEPTTIVPKTTNNSVTLENTCLSFEYSADVNESTIIDTSKLLEIIDNHITSEISTSDSTISESNLNNENISNIQNNEVQNKDNIFSPKNNLDDSLKAKSSIQKKVTEYFSPKSITKDNSKETENSNLINGDNESSSANKTNDPPYLKNIEVEKNDSSVKKVKSRKKIIKAEAENKDESITELRKNRLSVGQKENIPVTNNTEVSKATISNAVQIRNVNKVLRSAKQKNRPNTRSKPVSVLNLRKKSQKTKVLKRKRVVCRNKEITSTLSQENTNKKINNIPSSTLKTIKREQKIDETENVIRLETIGTEIHTFHCKKCEKIFLRKALLKKHEEESHPIENDNTKQQKKNLKCLECNECKRSFSNQSGLKRHSCAKKNLNKNVLNQKPTSENANNDHHEAKQDKPQVQLKPDTEPPVKKVCLDTPSEDVKLVIEEFSSTDKPKPSTKTKNKTNKSFICPHCNVNMWTSNDLKVHVLRVHEKVKSKICPYCSRGFTCTGDLTRHIRLHTGEKPFKCPKEGCNMAFIASGDLNKHQRTHLGDKYPRKFSCSLCGKTFKQRYEHDRHMRTAHTALGCKQYECHLCNRQFGRKDGLIYHLRIHAGIKPYTCKKCGKEFTNPGNFKKHMNTKRHDLPPGTTPKRRRKKQESSNAPKENVEQQ